MKHPAVIKYGLFFFIVAVLAGVDLWTKDYAEQRLATQRPGILSHNMVLTIGSEHDGALLEEYLRQELSASSEEEVQEIAEQFTITPHGQKLQPDSELSAGDRIEILQRRVVVIEDYWDFQYARNPGAAFGFLADSDDSFRQPFFIFVNILAAIFILGLLRTIDIRQKLFFWGLALISAGALGNFINRLQFDYVIDFIVWKVTDEYRWPTFNVADALICVGVAFVVVVLIREGIEESRQKKEALATHPDG